RHAHAILPRGQTAGNSVTASGWLRAGRRFGVSFPADVHPTSNGSSMPDSVAQSLPPRCRRHFLHLLVVFGALLICPRAPAAADEIHVLSSGATSPAYLELIPLFERQTGHKLVTDAVSTGLGASAIPARIRRGEPGDVVLTAAATLDDLIKEGRVAADSRVDLARSSIGMAVRKGAKQPDISTVEALKRKVLDAKS